MTTRPNLTLYDRDFFAWTQEQAAALRREGKDATRRGIDAENLAEEIEDMGKRERRELHNRLVLVLVHLLKWQFQPRRRGKSWRETLDEQRDQIRLVLSDSPSLSRPAAELIEEAYGRASRKAARETKLPPAAFPERCPYTLDQVLDDEFLPEA